MEYEKLQKLLAEDIRSRAGADPAGEVLCERSRCDSLMLYQILMGVEAVFGVIVEEEEAVRWNTVDSSGNIYRQVEKLQERVWRNESKNDGRV